jgi:Flp pilus assembly CpaE family ATPase
MDAIAHGTTLDEDLWSQMLGRWDKLDVLHAGELRPPRSVDLAGLHGVLAMARSQYQVICADLPSSLDEFSIDLMRESCKVFIVTTPEIVPLYLAGQRVQSLKELGLGDKMCLLLNRKSGRRGDVSDTDVARAVGLPVSFTFSNDYLAVEKAIFQASPVSHDTKLAQSILNLARSLAPSLEPKESHKGRKFLEFFHVPRLAEADEVWQG